MPSCGPCTLCCVLCAVPELDKPAGTVCKHICESGCSIYKDRPESCRRMMCGWLQSGAGKDLRPDKCGVVWERIGDTMYGNVDSSRNEFPYLEEQIKVFVSQGAKVRLVGR